MHKEDIKMNKSQLSKLKRGDIVYHKKTNMPVEFMSLSRFYNFNGTDAVNLNNPDNYGVSVRALKGYDYTGKISFNSRYLWGNGTEIKGRDICKSPLTV